MQRSKRREEQFMKKQFIAAVIGAALTAGVLAGCGSSTETTASTAASSTAAASEASSETSAAADTSSEAASDTSAVASLGTITVAASQTPHSEILAQAKPILAQEGWDLEVTVFEDYVQPNNVVESGDFDANYFQHVNYLNSFNEENGTHLVVATNGKIHYEPFGIYGGTKKSLDEIADGDAIAIPNDTTNEARALLLLQQEGLITLNLEIVEVEAAQVPKQLPSVAFGVINGNYALENGLSVADDALATESADGDAIQQYVNIIAVKDGNQDEDKIKALTDVLHSDAIVKYINDTYQGAVVPYDGEQ